MPKTKDSGFVLDDSELEPPYPHVKDKDDEPQPRKRPGIEENVWSRFDDDGWGIYNVQPTPTDNMDKNDK